MMALLLTAFSPTAAGQAQTLLSADFENGLGAWTVHTSPFYTVPWHVAADGECGAVTAMAACNSGPVACNYVIPTGSGTKYLRLHSPWFSLDGAGPWTFEFDYLKSADAGDTATLWIEAGGGDGIYIGLATNLPDASGLQHVSVTNPFGDFWFDKAVRLEFELMSDTTGNLGFGLMVDNVVVTNSGGWLGYDDVAKPGSAGTPTLAGSGTLTPGSANQVSLSHALPSSPATLVFGLQFLGAPFKGGTMVPKPLALVVMPTDPTGGAQLPFVLPPGLMQDTQLYFQCWIPDPGASFGFAASNSLVGSTG
jgi:hypothetical protein